MSIREYIQAEMFGTRAREHGSLVIYDRSRRYRDIALAMASEKCQVIDASQSIIEQRELATDALLALAEGRIHQLVVWIPAIRLEDDDGKQRDPFSVFAEIGAVFPQGDGDDYVSLCRRAKPDHIPEINRLFEQGEPSFEMVDALDQGGSWPKLKTLLGANSPKEIVLGIMSPKPDQEAALKSDPTWVSEAREFVQRILGHKLKTKGQTRQSISEELWQLILFSEFVFDSGGNIPSSLVSVARVGNEAKGLVYEVCDELRKHQDHKDFYRQTAQEIEKDMVLAEQCEGYTHVGDRDTFAFEERSYLQRLVERALEGQLEQARKIWESRRTSIWLSQEDRLAEWSLAARALDLLDVAARLSVPKFPTLESIVQGYAMTWRDLDRHHREMEQAVNQWESEHEGLEQLVARARAEYFRSVEALQSEFVRLVTAEGWPASGEQLIWNSQVFSKAVAPALEDGKRVAYFLVDSLRYELGVEIEKQLSDKLKITLQTVCAQLPTYTEVGMASLMPDAESALRLVPKDGKLVTALGGEVASGPAQRFAYLQSRKGDQCGDIGLDDLIRQKRPKVPDKVKLLIVRTRDIDAIAHGNPHQALELIPGLVRQIIRGLTKLAELGFDQAVIATDHGFILVHEQVAGNLAPRPAGNWLIAKSRCMLGKGTADAANLVMKGAELGIPGDFDDFAAPKTLVPYSRGELYYHEGLSLQECVLPCLTVQLEASDKKSKKSSLPPLSLSYRQGKIDRVTSRRPVVDLTWPQAEFFTEEVEIEVTIEARDSKENIVGWVSSGPSVNPATGGVRIKPGAALSVGLRMEEEFSGNFTVRVLDPSTNVALTEELKLKTGYLE
jgi:PglZ domain